jgi:hypothetical protein
MEWNALEWNAMEFNADSVQMLAARCCNLWSDSAEAHWLCLEAKVSYCAIGLSYFIQYFVACSLLTTRVAYGIQAKAVHYILLLGLAKFQGVQSGLGSRVLIPTLSASPWTLAACIASMS